MVELRSSHFPLKALTQFRKFNVLCDFGHKSVIIKVPHFSADITPRTVSMLFPFMSFVHLIIFVCVRLRAGYNSLLLEAEWWKQNTNNAV